MNAVKEEETYFLGTVDAPDTGPPWHITLNVCNKVVSFKIDTGADVSVMSYAKYNKRPNLQQTNAVLRSPGGTMICRGQFKVTVNAKNHEGYQLKICVADSDTDNLLGRSAASSLGLVQRLVTMYMCPHLVISTTSLLSAHQ